MLCNDSPADSALPICEQDIILDDRWTLVSNHLSSQLETHITDGSYTFASSTGCVVDSPDDQLHSKVWFKTPPLDANAIQKLESVQLFTRSRFQQWDQRKGMAEEDSFSWFDLIILQKSEANEPKKVNGVSLVWLSHANDENDFWQDPRAGQLFDENEAVQAELPRAKQIDQIKGGLEVRVRARK